MDDFLILTFNLGLHAGSAAARKTNAYRPCFQFETSQFEKLLPDTPTVFSLKPLLRSRMTTKKAVPRRIGQAVLADERCYSAVGPGAGR